MTSFFYPHRQAKGMRARGFSRVRVLLRRALLTAPLISYAVMTVWMSLNGQWTFLVFLIPSALMSVASICEQWSALSSISPSAAFEHETLSSELSSEPVYDPLDALLELSASEEELAIRDTWQHLVHAWLKPTTRVCLGAGPPLDICTQGPHVLVAGTTGSGKSILLQRWIYALAAACSPAHMQCIFLDFKGGATFTQASALPHCAGSVSNLNIAHAQRALRGLESEMIRREKLLEEARVADIRELSDPPPRLLILADEFFALVNALPNCAQLCATLISLGRSLGMHFILCTQNPLNQVSAHIKANMPLHLCLRVTDALQSVDMLGAPCAASIPSTLPGGAFCCHDGVLSPLRVVPYASPARLIRSCHLAAQFFGMPSTPALFSAPLPQSLVRRVRDVEGLTRGLTLGPTLGEVDNGITRSSWTLDILRTRVVVFCGMNAMETQCAFSSVVESLDAWQKEVSGRSIQDEEGAEGTLHGDSLQIHMLVEPDPTAASVSSLLHDVRTRLLVSVAQWSRFLSSVPAVDRTLWDAAVLCVPAHLASTVLIPGRKVSDAVRDVMQDYPAVHPLRFVVYDSECFYAQLFAENSQKSLEKSERVWFAMRKEKD